MFALSRSVFSLLVGLVMAAGSVHAQNSGPAQRVRNIGIIDFYGLHELTAGQLRSQLTFKVGDPITLGDHGFFDASKKKLLMVPGVSNARVNVVCCSNGLPGVFVGVEETGAPVMHFRAEPTGSVRLPPDILKTSAEFEQVFMKAVMSGHASEDDSEGHALLSDSVEARPIEDRLITTANQNVALLREVLRTSAAPEHRAVAAQLLGYASDMEAVVPDLIYGINDPYDDVRNNAMRALLVFSAATKVKAPHVPYGPFIAMLDSPVWTDRNKSSGALMQMAKARDPALLRMLRRQAMPSLVEMARWNDQDHSFAALSILGDIAGVDDKEILRAWTGHEGERIISAALAK